MDGKKYFLYVPSCTVFFFLILMKNGNCSLFWWSKQWSKNGSCWWSNYNLFLFSIIHNWKRYCCDLFLCLNTIQQQKEEEDNKTSYLDSLALVVFFSSLSSFQELISCLHITDVGTLNLIKFLCTKNDFIFLVSFLIFKDH